MSLSTLLSQLNIVKTDDRTTSELSSLCLEFKAILVLCNLVELIEKFYSQKHSAYPFCQLFAKFSVYKHIAT